MKNLKTKFLLSFISMALLTISVFSSCEDTNSDTTTGTLAITSVVKSVAGDLTPVTQGDPENFYIIRGSGFLSTQKVYFNDFDTYFNPTLITDTEIFVLIDKNTPYANASNELKIVTKSGSITYPFLVSPPAPNFGNFNPVNAADGEVITIYGNFFINPTVKIGTTTVPAISATLTEIKVKLPVGSNKKNVSITTISGTATSTYAIGTAIYDDIEHYGLSFPSWNNHTYVTDGKAEQGLIHIKKKMDAWGNFQGNWSWFDQIADFSGIRISIKADTPGVVKFIFNGDWSERNMLTVGTSWTTYVIPWSQLGNPDRVQNISFQNFTKNAANEGIENTFYIDNIGFALK